MKTRPDNSGGIIFRDFIFPSVVQFANAGLNTSILDTLGAGCDGVQIPKIAIT